jgi:hypothetical protein
MHLHRRSSLGKIVEKSKTFLPMLAVGKARLPYEVQSLERKCSRAIKSMNELFEVKMNPLELSIELINDKPQQK